jgi:hypothetical protein
MRVGGAPLGGSRGEGAANSPGTCPCCDDLLDRGPGGTVCDLAKRRLHSNRTPTAEEKPSPFSVAVAIMYAAAKVIFLLLLWACDWAGDPYCGNCPWSQAWGNQEITCYSVHHRKDLNGAFLAVPPLSSLHLTPSADQPAPSPLSLPGWDAPIPSSGCGLIYVFMNLRR